jgi:glycosyltransferase involved in cell wall biosynthesis
MNIVIFSKFDMSGGSEFRCAEFANGLTMYSDHKVFLMAEKNIPPRIENYLNPSVIKIKNCFQSPSYFYEADFILTINTDCKDFSTIDYWRGMSSRHNISLDLNKLKNKKMYFLYNFLISPSRHLYKFLEHDIDVGVIATNTKFYEEISKQDRYERIRILPRYILESPINPYNLNIRIRKPVDGITFGMHSKRVGNKWNNEIYKLINAINDRYGSDNKIKFRFMGVKEELKKKIKDINNVNCLKEDEESVSDFLSTLDIFLCFPEWSREEPWGRVIAEAMVSGCPVIGLNKGGTKDQILNYNNGILCKNFNDFYKSVIYFIEHKDVISKMSKNSIRISKNFYTKKIISKLLDIIEG